MGCTDGDGNGGDFNGISKRMITIIDDTTKPLKIGGESDAEKIERLTADLDHLRIVNFEQAAKINAISGARQEFYELLASAFDLDPLNDDNPSIISMIKTIRNELSLSKKDYEFVKNDCYKLREQLDKVNAHIGAICTSLFFKEIKQRELEVDTTIGLWSKEEIETSLIRAEMCESVTLKRDQYIGLLNLAYIGKKHDNNTCSSCTIYMGRY